MTNYEPHCPYCNSTVVCDHTLLIVDIHFQASEGGTLAEAFYERFSRAADEQGVNFDDIGCFTELLEDVEALCDDRCDFVSDGGPGMTTNCRAFYSKNIDEMHAMAEQLRNAKQERA